MQVSQFLDTEDPHEKSPRQTESPAFGSAVFKLGNFNAHVTILFVRDETMDLEGADKHELPSENQRDQNKVQGEETKGKEPLQNMAQEASSSKAAADEDLDFPFGFGYPIVEMDPADLDDLDDLGPGA